MFILFGLNDLGLLDWVLGLIEFILILFLVINLKFWITSVLDISLGCVYQFELNFF